MARAAFFAAFAVASTALGQLANWTEGLRPDTGNAITWALALFAGLMLGSLAEQHWPARPFKRHTRNR